MRFIVCLILFSLISLFGESTTAQQVVPFVETAVFEEGLVWNKWDTKNFIVLSLDKEQAIFLRDNIEKVRNSFLKSWGLPVEDAIVDCKLVCVPDRQTLKRLFNIDSPKYEVRKGQSGVSTCAIWFDYESLEKLPALVGSVSVADSIYPVKLNPGIRNGLVCLNESSGRILGSSTIVEARKVFTFSSESVSQKDREDTDRKCSAVCLLLRREYGIQLFSEFVSREQDENSLKSVFGLSFDELSNAATRYSKNLSEDMKQGKTPDQYLNPNIYNIE